MKALYVSHTAQVSGGERSLLDLLAALPERVQPHMATPDGPLREAVRALGVPTTSISGTTGSLRPHPVHTPRTIAELALSAGQVHRAARRVNAQVIHANSIRAGIVIGLARAPQAPRIVHVRDVLPPGALSAATLRLIAATATVIVANSRYTADAIAAAAPSARVEVVHNGVDLARLSPQRIAREAARLRLASREGVPTERVVLGVVAQLSPWKGQDTAIEALALARREGLDAHLLLIGSAKFVAAATRFDNEAYVRRLHELAAREGVEGHVSFLGEREDVPELIRALDLLLLPSWEEPFGRAVIEAMALEVPVLATQVGGPAEIVQEGVEGLLLDPHRPEAWGRAVLELGRDPARRAEMGVAGRRRAEEGFGLDRHAAAIVNLYERAIQALAKPRRTP